MKLINKLILPALLLSVVGLIVWRSLQNRDVAQLPPNTVEYALQLAGDNRPELEKVLQHYQGDSLQYLAAQFLIRNMPAYSGEEWGAFRGRERDTIFSLKPFRNSREAMHAMDSLSIRFAPIRIQPDVRTIDADFLISAIDRAFEAWASPRAAHLSFPDFCEYLLPYRIDRELMEDYRSLLVVQYDSLFQQAKQCATDYEVLQLVNGQLLKDVRWRSQMALYPGRMTVAEMNRMRIGDCNHLSDFGIKVFRTLGIAMANDFVPAWGNTNAGHSWTVALLNEQQVPFVACDVQPGEFEFWFSPAKVYRKTFSAQEAELLRVKSSSQEIPSELELAHCIDVTHLYYETIDIKLPLEEDVPTGDNCAFLCVYNNNRWVPVDWGKISEDRHFIQFSNINDSLLYCAMYYHRGELRPANAPFFALGENQVYLLKPDFRQLVTRSFPQSDPDDDNVKLYCWDKDWKELNPTKTELLESPQRIQFSGIPSDALFRVGNRRPCWFYEEQFFVSEPGKPFGLTRLRNN